MVGVRGGVFGGVGTTVGVGAGVGVEVTCVLQPANKAMSTKSDRIYLFIVFHLY